MNLLEIFGGGAGVVVILLTLIQITPIKVNPWGALAKKLGQALNTNVIEKVSELEKDINSLKQKIDDEHDSLGEYKARQARIRILRFGDEIRNKQMHTKEHFDDILTDIDMYEYYCATHPNFRNGISVQTIKYIRKKYDTRLEENDFL